MYGWMHFIAFSLVSQFILAWEVWRSQELIDLTRMRDCLVLVFAPCHQRQALDATRCGDVRTSAARGWVTPVQELWCSWHFKQLNATFRWTTYWDDTSRPLFSKYMAAHAGHLKTPGCLAGLQVQQVRNRIAKLIQISFMHRWIVKVGDCMRLLDS